jgi:hypothetical protein
MTANGGTRCLTIPESANCHRMEAIDLPVTDDVINFGDYTIVNEFHYNCLQCKDKFFRRQKSINIKRKDNDTLVNITYSFCVSELKYMREHCLVNTSTVESNVNIGEGGCE